MAANYPPPLSWYFCLSNHDFLSWAIMIVKVYADCIPRMIMQLSADA